MSPRDVLGAEAEQLLEQINVPSYVIDDTGVIRWVNAAGREIVGNVVGRQFTSIVAPDDRRRSRELFTQKVSGQASVTDGEVTVIDTGGRRLDIEVSSVPLRRGGRVVGVFGQVKRDPGPAAAAVHPDLTPRQAEVLQLIEQGKSTKQIATTLHLSPETVRNHVRHILRALDVHSRLEAAAVMRRHAPAA
jgi:PAS domain S-box-containing protein